MGIFNKYYKGGVLLKEQAKKKAQEIIIKKIQNKNKRCSTCNS